MTTIIKEAKLKLPSDVQRPTAEAASQNAAQGSKDDAEKTREGSVPPDEHSEPQRTEAISTDTPDRGILEAPPGAGAVPKNDTGEPVAPTGDDATNITGNQELSVPLVKKDSDNPHGFTNFHADCVKTTKTSNNGESAFDLENGIRKSTRIRRLTEKGLHYQAGRAESNFNVSIQKFKRMSKTISENLAGGEIDHRELLQMRNLVETTMLEVSNNFHEIVDLNPEMYLEYVGQLTKCETDTRNLLYDLTQNNKTC